MNDPLFKVRSVFKLINGIGVKYAFILFIVFCIGCGPKTFESKWTEEIAPASFTVRFETSKGNFDVETQRYWSPKAVDRFYQLVKYKYFDQAVFYRVLPGFVAQFGRGDTTLNNNWGKHSIPDEKVILGNLKGTLSFARSGKETRSTDLYVNLEDNSRLDTINYNDVKGFPAFGKVVQGMEVVESIYSGYESESVEKLDTFYSDRKKFLEQFPKLDTIIRAYLIRE